MDYSNDQIMKYLCENGIIDVAQIQADIMTQEQKKLLAMHPYTIYEGRDGKWYSYLPDQNKKRKKVKRPTKKALEDLIISYWKEHEENPTLKELYQEWSDLRIERNKISRASYDRYNRVFSRHFSEFGNRRIKDLTIEEVEDFLEDELATHHLTAKAFSLLKTCMIGTLKRAKRRRLLTFSISDLLENIEVSDRDFKKSIREDCEEVFNEEETRLFMDHCMDNLDIKNTAILLMFVTGLRVGELVTLKHKDIKDNCISIRRTETRYESPEKKGKCVYDVKEFPKTKAGVREVALPKDYQFLLSKMRSLNPFGEYIFTDENGQRITTNAIRRRMERICKTLGINRRSPHKVRKTVNTILMDSKLDNNLIKGQMGWSNITVGENHYHRNRKSIEKKVDILSAIPEFRRSV